MEQNGQVYGMFQSKHQLHLENWVHLMNKGKGDSKPTAGSQAQVVGKNVRAIVWHCNGELVWEQKAENDFACVWGKIKISV